MLGKPLEFLRYPELLWRAACTRRTPVNRWRGSDWISAFEATGFEAVQLEPAQEVEVTEAERSDFHDRFREKSLTDLGMLLVNLTATKPVSAS